MSVSGFDAKGMVRTLAWVARLALGVQGALGAAQEPGLVPVMSQNVLDLGPVDSGSLGHGQVRIANFGARTFHLRPPGNPGIQQIVVSYPSTLAIEPGGSVQVDLYGDFHGGSGDVVAAARIQTDDPGAPAILVRVHALVSSATDVRPYRDAVIGQKDGQGNLLSSKVRYEFSPGPGAGKFIQAWIEDPQAPLLLDSVQTPAGGILGALQLDAPKALSLAKKSGETRVLGITDSGQRNFFCVQWLVKP